MEREEKGKKERKKEREKEDSGAYCSSRAPTRVAPSCPP
jgi:hypothetical protein